MNKDNNSIKTLAQFRASKLVMRRDEYIKKFDDADFLCGTVITYGGPDCGYRIEIRYDGKYLLQFDRSEYVSSDLKRLEELFWDKFCKYEFLTPKQIKKDLNKRFKKMVKKHGAEVKYLGDLFEDVRCDAEWRANEEVIHQDFLKWVESDDVMRVAADRYLEQTTQYKTVFDLKELKEFYIREYVRS